MKKKVMDRQKVGVKADKLHAKSRGAGRQVACTQKSLTNRRITGGF